MVSGALVVPSASWACTQEEYLTDEQRASGKYDNSTPEYERAWGSGEPHSHGGEATSPAEPPAAQQPAPEPPSATTQPALERDAAEPAPVKRAPAERGQGVRPAPSPPVAAPSEPAPTATAPPVPSGGAAETAQQVATMPIAAPAHEAADPRRGRGKPARPKPSRTPAIVQPERVTDAARVSGTVAVEHGQFASSSWILVLGVAALALLGLGGAAAARRRPPLSPKPDPDVETLDAAVEAELQEIIAEERARIVAARENERLQPL